MNNSNEDSFLRLALSIVSKEQDDRALNPNSTNQKNLHSIENNNHDPSESKVADLFSQQAPPNAEDLTTADSVIASQMAKLSVTDREEVYMDVHGISDYVQISESPDFIQQNLADLQWEIDILPDKRAYEIAEKLGAGYVHDPDFRLMFLRCDKFDCPKAALRIIRHFQMKLDLFGMDKLVLDITQDDLDAQGMEVLLSCTGRLLNARDRGGRIINIVTTMPRGFKTDSVLRKGFYSIMMAFRDDEEIQRRGAVNIVFQSETEGDIPKESRDLIWKWPKLNEGSPMRLSALHWCCTPERASDRQAFLKSSLGKSNKVRVRAHYGTISECLLELQGHGIEPTCIPVNDQREITDLKEERKRLEQRRQYERLNFPLRSTIYVPFCHDVLLGKGTPFQIHPGNKRLRQLVSDRLKLYDKAEKAEKKNISLGIIETIRQSGGMFLKQDGGGGGGKWSRVDDEVARVKVSATFRTFRHRNKKQNAALDFTPLNFSF